MNLRLRPTVAGSLTGKGRGLKRAWWVGSGVMWRWIERGFTKERGATQQVTLFIGSLCGGALKDQRRFVYFKLRGP
jgi:hypothetical protein